MTTTATEERIINGTLISFLKDAAEKYGSRTALLFKPVFRYQQWSYERLWEEAGKVATLLQQKGIEKGDRVLLWGPNCPQWVLAFFGCMRAGIVAVPLDVRSAPDFVRKVAPKTRPKLAFVSRLTPQYHQDLELPEVFFEELDQLTRDLPQPRHEDVGPEDLAEIMFTSGTTGDPKGVMLTHKNLISNLESAAQYIAGRPTDRVVSLLPLSHMFEQVGGLLMPLRAGANITYPTSRQPSVLMRTLQERKVTLLLVVPQALELFMNSIEREVARKGKEGLWRLMLKVAGYIPFSLRRRLFRQVHKRFGGSLELIVSGGAALDPDLGAKWNLLGIHVLQAYGATEASPVISVHKRTDPRYDSAGLPIPGQEVRISEQNEILVKGPNITQGYWEAPEQTAAIFDGDWYKTGDQGLFDSEGYLHIKGRIKDMIVLSSGMNVFPDDIESLLRKHPDVTDAVVVGLPNGSNVEVHAAFTMDQPDTASSVVSWANQQLAEHQRIRGFTIWSEDDFPRTHTLKVKKGVVLEALKSGSTGISSTADTSEQAESNSARGLEHLVSEISRLPLQEMAPEKTLGEDLNLDSLNRVELLSAIEEEIGVYLDESQVGPDTTMGQLEELVQHGSRSGSKMKFSAWGMRLWCRALRGLIQRLLMFPALRLTNRTRVKGLENLADLPLPVLFVANHCLFLDNGLVIRAMPLKLRRRLALAAAAEPMRNPIWAVVNPLVGNGFAFSREDDVRASLENLGKILDNDWSVLIYPEGGLTIGGPMKSFKAGAGLIAVEGGVSVVPIHVHIERMGSPPIITFLRRSHVEIRFGKPMSFAPGTSYNEAAEQMEAAVRAL